MNFWTCSTTQEDHTGRYFFALAPLEAKLSAKTGVGPIWAFEPTSEINSWPRTLSVYTNRFISWRPARSFFFNGALA